MAGRGRGLNGILSSVFPERRLFIQSGPGTRYVRLTPLTQLVSAGAGLSLVAWVAVATATIVVDRVAADGTPRATLLQQPYQDRLDQLAAERDQRTAEARSAQERFQSAMEQVSRQQTAILQAVEERRELSTALDLMRDRLQTAIRERDVVVAANDKLVDQMRRTADGTATAGREDLTETLQTVADALSQATEARDAATAERAELQSQLADLELHARVNAQRQGEMVDELQEAVATSLGPMEAMLEGTGVDLDALLDQVRDTYSGQGGPLGKPTLSTRNYDDPEISAKFDQLLGSIDRANLLRIAADKIPYAVPVKTAYRFTSGFGGRSDPFGRGHRRHEGVDLAAPKGTPIYAAADGVVTTAGRESGYGNVVRVRHEFGFETVYAHQSVIRVKVGQQVSRGERIGDMGSTGRSTGSHLHYEVRVNGQPVNPMTYLEAAKDVLEAQGG